MSEPGGTGVAGGEAEVVLDARGLRCPQPVIRAAAQARYLPAGTVLRVLWSDPAAGHDLPAWARMRGHEVVASEPGQGSQGGSTTVRLGEPMLRRGAPRDA